MCKYRWSGAFTLIAFIALVSSVSCCTASYEMTAGESGSTSALLSYPDKKGNLSNTYQQDLSTISRPVIAFFTASPDTISPGQAITLSWSVSGATAVTIDPMIGSVNSSGTKQLLPDATTTYTLAAINEDGRTIYSITVLVVSDNDRTIGCDPVSGRNQSISFTWEQLCLSDEYQVQIARDTDFAMIVFDSGIFAATSSTSPALVYPAGRASTSPVATGPSAAGSAYGLEAGHTYYWRARVRHVATGQSILSPWSQVGTFTVKTGLPATTQYPGVKLLTPDNGCTGCPVEPALFSWSPFKGTTKYKFILANDAALSDIIAEAELATTSYEYEGRLDYSSSYYWQVMALEPSPGDPSATFILVTETAPESSFLLAPESEPKTPFWAWVVVGIGAILTIVTIVLTFMARRK